MGKTENIPVETYVSPDGLLHFCVITASDGDVTLGFYGFQSHTHADILSALTVLKPAEAVSKYVSDLIGGKSVVVLYSVDNVLRNVWVSDDPVRDSGYASSKYAGPNDSVLLRYWDGTLWTAEPATISTR